MTAGLIPVLSKSTNPRVVSRYIIPKISPKYDYGTVHKNILSATILQIIVSSGGMYTVKLDTKDMQFENMRSFDGTFAYAQNKRQQIVMTQQFAEEHPNIHFSAMHPGWADTPGKNKIYNCKV